MAWRRVSDILQLKEKAAVDNVWHVIFLAALVLFLNMSSIQSSGYIFVGFIEEYDVERNIASWPISILSASSDIAGILGFVFNV